MVDDSSEAGCVVDHRFASMYDSVTTNQ